MKKAFLSCLLLVLCSLAFAQSTLKGKVLDKATQEPLPFVNIMIDESYGNVSDIDGNFTIKLKANAQKIRFSFVGFKILTLEISQFPKNGIIYLSEDNTILEGVEIRPTANPAHRIIRLAVANRDKNNPEKISSFQYESYNKFYGTLEAIAPNEQIQLKDSAEINATKYFATKHLFMSENISQRIFIRPNRSKETVIANRFSGLKNPNFASVATDFQPFSFYNSYLNLLNKNYLNPISKGTLNQYDFTLKDTLYQQQDTVYIITFEPLEKKNFLGLKGVVYINTNGYAVQNVIAESAEKDELIGFKIQQQYEQVQSQWFPTQLDATFSFNGFKVGNRPVILVNRSYIYKIQLNPPIKRTDFDEVTFEISPKAALKDSIFWQKNRFDTLSTKELNTFQFLDSVGRENNLEGVVNLMEIATFAKIPLFKKLDIPITSLLNFNEYEGLRLGMGIYTSPKLSERFTLGGYFAYGFRDEQWKYGGSLEVLLHKKRNLQLGFYYENDVFEPAQSQLTGSVNWLNNQFRQALISRMDKTENLRASISWKPLRYTTLETSVSKIRKETGYDYSFLATDANPSIFNFTEFATQITYHHKQEFIKVSGRKRMISAGFPVVSLRYTQGFDNWLESEFEYRKLEGRIEYEFPIRKIGRSHIRLQGAWLDKPLPYPLLFNLYASNASGIPYIVDNSFQTAGLYEFTAQRYVALLYRHNFGSLFFRGERFKPQFIVVQNTAFGSLEQPEIHSEIEIKDFAEGFLESGLEISRLLHIKYLNLFYIDVGAGAFFRYGQYRNDEVSDNWVFKFSLRSSF